MARIAFFTECLPPDSDPIADFSFELMRGLAEQQHELKIFSTFRPDREPPRLPARMEILFPFRKWSWFELPPVIPILMHFQPEILHLIQPRREALQGLTNAMTAVSGLLPLIGRPALITSFYDLREGDWKTHRLILSLSSAITVSTQTQFELVEKWLTRLQRKQIPLLSVVPIPTAAHATFDDHLTTELSTFVEAHPQFILVPGCISSHLDQTSLFSMLSEIAAQLPHLGIVFGGDWGATTLVERRRLMSLFEDRQVGGRVMIAGSLSQESEVALLKGAAAVFFASLPSESLDLIRLARLALQASSVVVLNQQQARGDSLDWCDRETAFISGLNPSDWGMTLFAALSDHATAAAIRSRLPDFSRREAVDQPGNIMSRSYAEVLSRQRPNIS